MLILKLNENETPLQGLIRAAEPHGLVDDCKKSYDRYLSEGYDEEGAAYYAGCDWDVLSYYEPPECRLCGALISDPKGAETGYCSLECCNRDACGFSY